MHEPGDALRVHLEQGCRSAVRRVPGGLEHNVFDRHEPELSPVRSSCSIQPTIGSACQPFMPCTRGSGSPIRKAHSNPGIRRCGVHRRRLAARPTPRRRTRPRWPIWTCRSHPQYRQARKLPTASRARPSLPTTGVNIGLAACVPHSPTPVPGSSTRRRASVTWFTSHHQPASLPGARGSRARSASARPHCPPRFATCCPRGPAVSRAPCCRP
jgi:hypothetical protein